MALGFIRERAALGMCILLGVAFLVGVEGARNEAPHPLEDEAVYRNDRGSIGAPANAPPIGSASARSKKKGALALETFVECPSGSEGCLTFGFTYPGKTSALGPEGELMLNGYILWAELVNQSPQGILKNGLNYRVALRGYDDESSPAIAETGYLSLISDVDFLLGPYGTSLTERANWVANEHDRVIVFANAAGEDIFRKGYPMIFGVGTSAARYAESAIFELYHRGARSAVIMYSTTSFTASVANGAVASLAAAGMDLREIVGYDGSLSESVCESLLTSLRAYDPDVLFAFVLLREAETVVKVAKAMHWKPRAFFMTSAPSDPAFVAKMGSDAFHLLGPSQWESSLPYFDSFFGSATNYAVTYKRRFNSTPSFIAAQSSAAARVLQLAIERSANHTDDQTLAFTLQKLGNVQTFYGPISFNRAGSNTGKPIFVTQVLPPDGRIAVVAPEPVRVEVLVYSSQSSPASALRTSAFDLALILLRLLHSLGE